MPPDPPMRYYGYLRCDHGPWQVVCCAATEEACQMLLLDHDPGDARLVDRMVLPRGRHPEDGRWQR